MESRKKFHSALVKRRLIAKIAQSQSKEKQHNQEVEGLATVNEGDDHASPASYTSNRDTRTEQYTLAGEAQSKSTSAPRPQQIPSLTTANPDTANVAEQNLASSGYGSNTDTKKSRRSLRFIRRLSDDYSSSTRSRPAAKLRSIRAFLSKRRSSA